MPRSPGTPCAAPGCPAVGRGRFCAKHKRDESKRIDERRGTAASRGYGHKWRAARSLFLVEHPLCVKCWDIGRLVAASVVDHITPHKGGDALFWSRSNWQALCKRCHDAKTARDDGAFGRNPVSSRATGGRV
ncbi:MAG: HNH endonuclease [Mycobacterium sp.]